MGIHRQAGRYSASDPLKLLNGSYRISDPDGQVMLLFLPSQSTFPIDGLRYQDQETRFVIPVGSTRVSLDVFFKVDESSIIQDSRN
jgi:hypothetical protein